MAVFWLHYDYVVAAATAARISQERGCATAAAWAGREWKCLQFPRPLESPSSLWASALPTLGSVNSVNSKTVDLTNRIRDTRHCWEVYNHDKKEKKSTQHFLGCSLEKNKTASCLCTTDSRLDTIIIISSREENSIMKFW